MEDAMLGHGDSSRYSTGVVCVCDNGKVMPRMDITTGKEKTHGPKLVTMRFSAN